MLRLINYSWSVFFVVILFLLLSKFANSATLVFIQPVSNIVGIDSSPSVEIRVSDVEDLYGAEIELSFDPSILEASLITPGEAPKPDFIVSSNIDNTSGTISYAVTQLMPTLPVTGNFLVVEIDFEAIAVGITNLNLTNVILSDNNGTPISFSTQNGEIIIVGIPPGTFNKSIPANQDANIADYVTLAWEDSAATTSYEYCYDTQNNDMCDISWNTVEDSTATIGPLTPGTSYYWQVRAINSVNVTEANNGSWWTFNTGFLPVAFGKFRPSHESIGQPLSITLHWGESVDATGYEICFDLSDDNICSNSWLDVGPATYLQLTELLPSNSYFWQVRARNSTDSIDANAGNWWTFNTEVTANSDNKIGIKEAIYALQVVSGLLPTPLKVGDALPADVLVGKTFSNSTDIGLEGAMPQIDTQTIVPGVVNKDISEGYHDGTGTVVGDSDLITGNIKNGVTIFDVPGNAYVVDTSDGGATAQHILGAKIAYAAGVRIVGERAYIYGCRHGIWDLGLCIQECYVDTSQGNPVCDGYCHATAVNMSFEVGSLCEMLPPM